MISSAAATKEVMQSLTDMWAPVERQSVCKWIESNVELPSGEITGKVRLDYIPYAREILERVADRETRHLTLMFPTQSGKTSILIMGMLYKICRDPRDALWVMGNTDQVRTFCKERLHPFVYQCRAALDLVPRTKRGVVDRHFFGFQNMHFKSMILNLVGAGSATNLKSRPRGLVVMDEVDSYDQELGIESGAIQLVEERMKTFSFTLSIKASSPTMDGVGIAAEYENTDKRQYWVPCPRCGVMILLRFSIKSDKHGDCGLRWWHENEDEAKTDDAWDHQKVRANAYYKCQECGGMIHDFERRDILQGGEWRPQNNRSAAGRHGYHINSLYSTLGPLTSLGNIASEFLMAKGLRSDLKTFITDWLAETWDETKAYDFKEVRLQAFDATNIAADDSVALMAIDVQQDGYWVLVRRFQRPSPKCPNGQSWLIFADYVRTEDELVEIQKEFKVENENVTMDMAHRPTHVGRIVIAHKWLGVWGSPNTKKFYHNGPGGTRLTRPYSVTQWLDAMRGTAWESRSLVRVPYILFYKDGILDIVSSLRHAEPAIWHCTINAHKDYARHLNSRVKRQQKNKRTGRVEWVWHELTQSNHLADCESHVTVRALTLGLLSLPDESTIQNTA